VPSTSTETRAMQTRHHRTRGRQRLAGGLAVVSAIAVGLVGTVPAAAAPAPADPVLAAAGDPIWQQEFDGPAGAAPDSSVWNHEVGDHGWGNKELQNYTTSRANSALDGQGNLVITARREADGSYTSARMTTKDKYEL